MRIIGVIDLLGGRAVHARKGLREQYRPVQGAAGVLFTSGDAVALANVYAERLGVTELYVADVDAIVERQPNTLLIERLVACARLVWLDAGISTVEQALRSRALGVATVIVGLETLESFDALAGICDAVDGNNVAFSLDLRHGEPVLSGVPPGDPPEVLAARAADAGATSVIVLDLARVGTEAGVDLELIGRVRRAVPDVTLLAGGGVGGAADLVQLAEAGCDATIVATALHDGRLGPADVAAITHHSVTR